MALAAIIHVKLSGEGDFGPVDLECAISPARLPVVMAALFGQPPLQGGAPVAVGQAGWTDADYSGAPNMAPQLQGHHAQDKVGMTEPYGIDGDVVKDGGAGSSILADNTLQSQSSQYVGDGAVSSTAGAVEPGLYITSFVGSLGDLVVRLQPRGFAETILIAAIWLHYREGRGFVTRDDIRRLLRRQDHLRLPRNFSRDFQAAVTRGYLEAVEGEDGYAVSANGYQWFHSECMK